jgi:hypothetical protein
MSQANPTDAQIDAYASSWVKDGDQTAAWRAAFPDSKAKPDNVYSAASRMHKATKVQARIAEYQKLSREQSEEEFAVSVADIKKRLLEAADLGAKIKKDAQGNSVPHSIQGLVSALAEINKMDGNHAAVKADLTSSDGSMSPKPGIDASKLSNAAIEEILRATADD